MHIIKHNVQLSPLFQHYHQLRPSLEGRQTDIYGCTKGVEIVILFSLWVSIQGTALNVRNCTTGITDGFYEAVHCTNPRLYGDANSIAGLFSVAHQPPVRRMYSCESGFLNAV